VILEKLYIAQIFLSMLDRILLTTFLTSLCFTSCKQEDKRQEEPKTVNKVPLSEDTTKRTDTSATTPEQASSVASFNGIYFCPETKELYYLEGDESSIKRVFYTKAKGKFLEQKIAAQRKLPMESSPLDPDYLLKTTREHKFGVYPSGQRYFVRKDNEVELVFFKLTEKVAAWDAETKPNIMLAEALSQTYLEENSKTEDKPIKVSQLEMRYSIGFKYKDEEMVAIVNEDFSIEMTLPEGKIVIKDGMGALNLEIQPKGKSLFTLVQKIK